ncbi:MAG: V-type ATP synthase subunit E [Spirochaetia bacterium]|jgi:V/A-type H+-transporting ATPase subunit E|nr:V-type ATP synthase subunit E [Spirochaetia bacterium]
MEVQLKELIEKIKIDGVKDAEVKAADIVKKAEAKAEEIVAKAKKEASRIITDAKEEAVKSGLSGQEALKQAGRDLVLNLQTKITDLFNIIIKQDVASAMDDKVLAETIVKLIGSWKGSTDNLQVLLSEKDYKNVENVLRTKLADQIKKGFEVKASKSLDAGFLVSMKDGSAYHNFSAEGIAEVLSEYLNPRISALLSEGVKGKKAGA